MHPINSIEEILPPKSVNYLVRVLAVNANHKLEPKWIVLKYFAETNKWETNTTPTHWTIYPPCKNDIRFL